MNESMCQRCKKRITADEGRFSCANCPLIVCEECGKQMKWDKVLLQRCVKDGSLGMMWLEGEKANKP